MGKTKKHPRFWGDFLTALLITLIALGQLIYDLTKEPLIQSLMFDTFVVLILGILWFNIKDYRLRHTFPFRMGKWWLLGFVLLWVAFSMTDLVWVKLCLILLAGGFMLKDTIPRRDRSETEQGEQR